MGGELKLTSQINESSQEGHAYEPKELTKFRQRKRVLQCAINLAKKLDEFILVINVANGSASSEGGSSTATGEFSKEQEKDWRQKCDDEAKELASNAFGGTLVGIIGEIYREQARIKLDTFDGIGIQTKTFGRRMSNSVSVAGSGLRAAYAASEVSKLQKKAVEGEGDDGSNIAATGSNSNSSSSNKKDATADDKASKFTESMMSNPEKMPEGFKEKVDELAGHMFNMMWSLTQMDIESTLVKVCRRVIRDNAVDERTRSLRTKLLLILGEEFMRYGVPSEKGISELLSKMTSAMAGKTPGETGEEEDETDEQKSLNKDKAPDTVEKAMTMSVRELKAAVSNAGIDDRGFSEKIHYAQALIDQK